MPVRNEDPQLTECSCTEPGWCARHSCHKTAHWHQLCRTRSDYFQLWEEGRGPGQFLRSADNPTFIEGPGIVRRAINFGTAVVRHLADGTRHVDETVYAHRLQICQECPQCDKERMVCLERSCGCRLATKARWRTSECPLRKWPKIDEPPPGE